MLDHLAGTFAEAECSHPDLMEPYSVLLAEASTLEDRIAIMREGLRKTLRDRYPMPEGFYDRSAGSAAA